MPLTWDLGPQTPSLAALMAGKGLCVSDREHRTPDSRDEPAAGSNTGFTAQYRWGAARTRWLGARSSCGARKWG
jgi:hypothetical protein